MTDKELRHLSRAELIDIIYELQKQSDKKDAQMQKLRAALEERTLRISKAGSIAEAAISVNGVFEAAQAAADQYLTSVKEATADMERTLADAEEKRKKILSDAEEQAADLVRKAEEQSANLVRKAEEQSANLVHSAEEQVATMNAEAEKRCAEKWSAFEHRANDLIAAHKELKDLLVKGSGA